MFQRFLSFIKEIFSKMFTQSTIKDKLNIDVSVSSEMSTAIDVWYQMYINNSSWFAENGVVKGLNLPASIAAEIARIATIEMKTEITGSKRAEYLDSQFKQVRDNVRVWTEKAAALGGIFAKPYVNGGKIDIDFIQANAGFPIAFDSSGDITSAVFIEQITKGKTYYTRLEYHHVENDGYHVDNHAYQSDNASSVGREISLTNVPQWEYIEPSVTIANVDKPLFAYLKVPLANNIDPASPLGVSVYARAVDAIMQADKQYSRIIWEYEGSELAVHADITAFTKDEAGNPILPKGKKRLYRTMGYMGDDKGKVFDVFSPTIRDASLYNGLNNLLRTVEFSCNLAYGTLSDPQNVDKTAEEIKASKQRSYAFISDFQKSIKQFFDDLLYAMDVYATLYKLAPNGKYALNAEFSDSIIIDTQKEFANRLQMVSIQAYTPEQLYAWYFGVSDEEAKEALANTQSNSLFETGA